MAKKKRQAKASKRSARTQVKAFTEEERAGILLALQADNPDVAGIAKANKMGEARLRKWATDAGISLPSKRGTPQATIDEALAMVDARVDGQPSVSEIAKQVGVTDQSVYAWIRRRAKGQKAAKKATKKTANGRNGARVLRSQSNGYANGAMPGSHKPPSQVPLALAQVEALLETSLQQVRQANTAMTAFWAAFGGGEPNGNQGSRQSAGVGRHPRG